MFISTKTYGHEIGLSCCFRQHRAESHCRFLHGYAMAIRLEFEADELDANNWVVDFGSLKPFKERLVDMFDHVLLVAEDDPYLDHFMGMQELGLAEIFVVEATGCEAFAKQVFDMATDWLEEVGYSPRVRMRSVEVREHGANSAIYTGAK